MDTLRAVREKYIYRLFRTGIVLKGILSATEIFAGVFVLLVDPSIVGQAIITASQRELLEEPGNFIASHALTLAQQFSLTPQMFLAVYLLSRGIIKFALVIALLKGRLWAYPASLVVLGLFMIYQIYEIAIGHSAFLIALTLFDIIVMWLIWHEYRLVSRHIDPAVIS
jgi:uncharacterized membrane protein